MTAYRIDGARFSTLEEFFDEVTRVMIPDDFWGHNLDAFDDILHGGFGTPDEGFELIWDNADLSRDRLGYPETVRQLELRLKRCHRSWRPFVAAQLDQARAGQGDTVFDWLIEIIEDHGPGGRKSESNVTLTLRPAGE